MIVLRIIRNTQIHFDAVLVFCGCLKHAVHEVSTWS